MADAGSLAAIDEVYAERNAAALAFCKAAWLLRWHVGYTAEDPDWPVIFVDTPEGQVSWHISADELPPGLAPYYGRWDGHTTAEKHERLRRLVAASPAPGSGEKGRGE